MKTVIFLIFIVLYSTCSASDLTIGSNITSPISGCDLTSSELVKATIINAETTAYSGTFAVNYQLNNNPVVTENVTIVVLPVGGTVIYEFSTLLDLTACGVQTLTISVTDINDTNSSNDTVSTTITNDCSPLPGVFSGPSAVCETGNSGQITLTGNTGIISDWAFSDDNGTTTTLIGNTANTQTFSNLITDRLYRVYYDSQHGLCPSDSTDYQVMVDAASFAGILSSDSAHCDTILPTTLFLNGYNGSVSHYKLSLNGGTSYTTFTSTFDTLEYTELGTNFQFFAVTQNGTCPQDSSNIVNISILDAPVAGEIIGEDTLCSGITTNDLELINFDGVILDWEYTVDNGNTWLSTGLTASSITLSGITATSAIRAIVEKTPCGTDTATFNITIINGSSAGNISGNAIICGTINTGIISINGNNGNFLGWLSTIDGGTTFNTIAIQNDSITYNNISTTTSYAAIVQFESCPPDTSNFATISINAPTIAGQIINTDSICPTEDGLRLELVNNTGSVLGWEFSSDNGSTWQSTGITDSILNQPTNFGTTLFRVIVQNGQCDSDTAFSSVFVFEPLPSFSFEDTIFPNDSLQLNAGSGVSFLWSPNIYIGNNLIANPSVSPPINTTYQVTVTDSNNCETVSIHNIIIIENSTDIIINNLITPNGDGFNDTWRIENIELFPNNSVMVFNTYGQLVFEATTYQNNWDVANDNLPDGTYLYIIKTEPQKSPIKGTLTILNSK